MNQKILLTLFAVFLSVFCMNAQKSQTVNVVDAGTLATLLGADKITVTDLTLTGTINDADFTTIKQMTALKNLDMLDVDVINGAIPASAFAGRVMDKLVLPRSLKTIGNNSFQVAILSQSLELPSTVESIGFQAFKGSSLKGGLILSESLRTIQHGAFWGVKVPSLNFENSPNLEEIQYYVFVDAQIDDNLVDLSTCTNLKRFTNNNRDQGTFYNYTGHVTLPFYLEVIPPLTFSNFKGTFDLSLSLKRIEANAFLNCLLEEIELPRLVNYIGVNAFKGCSNLSKIISINPVPPVLGAAVFSGVDANNCTLVIPDRGLEAYATADQWKDFINTMRSVSGLRAADLKLNEDIDQTETVISVYPNPTTDVLNVRGDNIEKIDVYSIAGRLVKSITKANTINLQDLSSGIYMVKVTTTEGVTSERVVKK